MITETARLTLRALRGEDYDALCAILQDTETMYAYAHAFSDTEVQDWLNNQLRRYREEGFGLWAMVRKADNDLIGQCGITLQDWQGRRVPEIGYLFRRDCWHRGYATEAAAACRDYAFGVLALPTVYSIIRDNNEPSIKVAQRLGMTERGRLVKHYYGMDMPHTVYGLDNPAKKP